MDWMDWMREEKSGWDEVGLDVVGLGYGAGVRWDRSGWDRMGPNVVRGGMR